MRLWLPIRPFMPASRRESFRSASSLRIFVCYSRMPIGDADPARGAARWRLPWPRQTSCPKHSRLNPDLFRAACNMGLEGLVSRRCDRPYQAGRSNWIKVKNRKHPAMSRVMEAFG